MATTTSVLFGPHQTARSPARRPAAARPLASRFTRALSSARETTASPSTTAGAPGPSAADAARGSRRAEGIGGRVIVGQLPAGVTVRSTNVPRLDPSIVAVPHGPPRRRDRVL